MPASRQSPITQKDLERQTVVQKQVTSTATTSIGNEDDATVAEFLENRSALLDGEIAYHHEYLRGLNEIDTADLIEDTMYEREKTLRELNPFVVEWRALSRSKKVLDFYDGRSSGENGDGLSWCQSTWFWRKKRAIVAHLVPRSMSDALVQRTKTDLSSAYLYVSP